jgi:hypothetical protein
LTQIRPLEAGLIHAERQAEGGRDMRKPVGTYSDYAKGTKNCCFVISIEQLVL